MNAIEAKRKLRDHRAYKVLTEQNGKWRGQSIKGSYEVLKIGGGVGKNSEVEQEDR